MACVTPACFAISVVLASAKPLSKNSVSAACNIACSVLSFLLITTLMSNNDVNSWAKIEICMKDTIKSPEENLSFN